MIKQSGSYLKLIIGPMFSSKSSSLLSEVNRYKYITDKILVINSELDIKRHPKMEVNEGIGYIKTHDEKTFPAIMLKNLQELKKNVYFNKKYNYADIILIDEGQFYDDLYDFLNVELCKTRKKFIVAGLSSDYNMKPIGSIIQLVPIADDIIKLSSLCMICKDGTPGNFTKLIKNDNKNQSNILIGSNDSYYPCCRFHFLN
jgi:thymidine kinase